MSRTFEQTKAGYRNMWNMAKILPEKHQAVIDVGKKACSAAYRPTFEAVEKATGVSWWFIAALLYRESDMKLSTYLGNGQSLRQVTTVVPKGRGPFLDANGNPDFVAGAIDAFNAEPNIKKFLDVKLWSIERALYSAEEYNGEGYENHNVNDPYVWAGTSLEQDGLYESDGNFNPTARDNRLGVAAVIAGIAMVDPSILVSEPTTAQPKPTEIPMSPANQTEASARPTVTVGPGTIAIPPNAVTTAFHIDIAGIENAIESSAGTINMIAMFVPQLKPILVFLPIIEGILKMLAELQNSQHDPATLMTVVATHFHDIGDRIQATKTKMGQ